VTQDLYPKMINVIRELAGGAFIMLPSSFKDWTNPVLAPIIRKTQRSAAFDPEGKVKFLKAAWDAVGSEFGSRHTQYEMFYAGAQFVTAGTAIAPTGGARRGSWSTSCWRASAWPKRSAARSNDAKLCALDSLSLPMSLSEPVPAFRDMR